MINKTKLDSKISVKVKGGVKKPRPKPIKEE